MKYTDYYNHLLIESWKTYKPSSNPKVLLYDFYVLSYLSTLPLGPEQKGFSGGLMGRNSNEVRLDIEHAQSVLLPLLVNKLKNALFLAICAEIRHIFDNEQKWSKYKNNQLLKYYVRYYKSLSGNIPPEFQYKRDVKNPRVRADSSYYVVSYKAAMLAIKKSGSNTTAFAELAADLFNNMTWTNAFGGKKWAAIAEGYLLLVKANTNNQKQVAIDHAYDLQHNTGTALNKVKDFSIDGFDWLQIALDHKRDAKSMYELLPYCSSDMKKLALEAFKISNVKKPDGIIKTNLFNKPSSYNIGDELVLNGQDYKVYGTIVDKNKLNEAFVIGYSDSGDSDSKKSIYQIKITKIEGNAPKNYSVNKIVIVKYKYMENWEIISNKNESNSYI